MILGSGRTFTGSDGGGAGVIAGGGGGGIVATVGADGAGVGRGTIAFFLHPDASKIDSNISRRHNNFGFPTPTIFTIQK
jgi:hypothetical protein